MKILAIDPGSEQSGFVEVDAQGQPGLHGKIPNGEVIDWLRLGATGYQAVVLESMSPRGLPTSQQEMLACFEAGRFAEAAHLTRVDRITRDAVKYHLCGRRNGVNDSTIRAALIDRYGGDGGKDAAIGRKATPGPLFGITADAWAALALAVTWLDTAAR